MRRYYISCQTGNSGIAKYSRDFYRLILAPRGYIFMDSSQNVINILSTVSSRDHVHIEIGIFQKNEIAILFTMLRANYKNVSVTLHDAPLLKYPFFEFRNSLLNNASKVYDKYMNSLGAVDPFIRKIKSIFVLSQKGVEAVRKRYGIDNVFYLPHIIDKTEIRPLGSSPGNFIFFGFIGRNKGLEYGLQIHEQLLKTYPDTRFFVVGQAMGKQTRYFDYLKSRYQQNVDYYGFVEERELNAVFEKATFAMLMFKDYRFFKPFSGSVLYSLVKGKIVFSNAVNAIDEIIHEGKTGYYLNGKLRQDIYTIQQVINNRSRQGDLSSHIYNYLMENHSEQVVSSQYID